MDASSIDDAVTVTNGSSRQMGAIDRLAVPPVGDDAATYVILAAVAMIAVALVLFVLTMRKSDGKPGDSTDVDTEEDAAAAATAANVAARSFVESARDSHSEGI